MVISPTHAPRHAPTGAPHAQSETLGATLAAAGRSAPIWLLTTLCATGAAATTVIAIAARRHWILSLPLALVAAFGAWGLTEQGRAAVNQMQSLDATQRYIAKGILHAAGVLIIIAGAALSTILVFAITFFLAGDAPNL